MPFPLGQMSCAPLGYATPREQDASRCGEVQHYVLSPEQALDLAAALGEAGLGGATGELGLS